MDLTLPRSSSAPRSSKKSESKEVDDLRNEVILLRASLHEAHERNDSARDSEKRLRAFRGSALDLVAEIDSDGRFLYASPNHFDLLGWTPKELLGTACFDYVHPDERQAVADGLKSTIRSGGIPTTSICRFRHRNGSIRWLEISASPFAKNESEWRGIFVARDITARMEAEAKARREAAHVCLLQKAAQAANQAGDVDDAVRAGLELVCEHIGWPLGHAVLPGDHAENCADSAMKFNPGGLWHIRDAGAFAAFRRDPEVEASGLCADSSLSGRVFATGKPVWIPDVTTDAHFERAELARECGLHAGFAFPIHVGEEIAGVLEFFSTEVLPHDQHLLEVVSEIGIQIGRVFERQRARSALVEREERLRAVLSAMELTPVLVLDRDSTVRAAWGLQNVNPTGITRDDLIGRKLTDFSRRARSSELLANLERVFETGENIEHESQASLPGGDFHFELFYSPMRDKDGDVTQVLVISRNVTDRLKTEEALRATSDRLHKLESKMHQAQRLESLGVLAGGIAHDFNNLLVGMQGNAQMALRDVDPASPSHAMLEDICEASERAAELTRELLAYAGKGKIAVQPLDLTKLVKELASLLRSSVPRTAELEIVHIRPSNVEGEATHTAWVEGDPTQIRQVMMNLITNAAEALENRSGVVRIRTGVEKIGPEYLAECFPVENIQEGEYAFVEVEDTGCGMSKETLRRIFDPFFTTKFQGRGLGLAAVLGIVSNHHGTLHVCSAPDAGTVFRVLIPTIASPSELAADANDSVPEEAVNAQGTVLVVDDERAVRTVAGRMLARGGFDVLTADGGEEAVRLFAENRETICAVVLDATMPNMDGEATYHALRMIRHSVPIVLCTGHSEWDAAHMLEGKTKVSFLQKPFTLATLTSSVRAALEL